MGIIETGITVAKMLIPPKSDDPSDQQRWRWLVFTSLIGAYTVILLHIVLACGLLPTVYPGFALASEEKDVQKRIDVIASLSLEHEIRDKTFQLCHEQDQRKRDALNDELSKLQREYYDISKNWYNVPSCGLL
jgi:FtsZ-binding cell division protein ZapB